MFSLLEDAVRVLPLRDYIHTQMIKDSELLQSQLRSPQAGRTGMLQCSLDKVSDWQTIKHKNMPW